MTLTRNVFLRLKQIFMSNQMKIFLNVSILVFLYFTTIVLVYNHTKSQPLTILTAALFFITVICFKYCVEHVKALFNPYINAGKGNKHYIDRNFSKAIKYYSRAILFGSKDSYYYSSRAYARMRTKDFKGAAKDYDVLIELQPWNYLHFLSRGVCKHMIGDQEGAIKDFNQSIILGPFAIEAYYFRGNAKRIIGDEIGALKDLKASGLRFEKPGNVLNYYFPEQEYCWDKVSTYN